MSAQTDCLITVLMPAYNAERYILPAIESILQQSFGAFELLIIDDGSSDNTGVLVAGATDSRLRYIRQVHQGVSAALNHGLAHAKGRYIARFDADDLAHPMRLQKQFEFLETHPDYVLVGSDATYLLESGEYLFDFTCVAHTNEEICRYLYTYCPFIHSAVMYRRDAVVDAGGYSLHAHNFEDHLLWIQLQRYGKFHNLHAQLVQIRFNPGSVTIDEKWRGRRFRELKQSIIKRGTVDAGEGEELRRLLQQQDTSEIRLGAYHALCAKKFLVNNYRPGKAREHILSSMMYRPWRIDNYALLFISFFPHPVLKWLQQKTHTRL